MTLMQLRAANAACILAAFADAVSLAWAYFRDRVVFISGTSHPTSFSPDVPPPAWLLWTGLAVIAVLVLVSGLVIDPAIARAKAAIEAHS